MRLLATIWAELVGLFVDDGLLAVGIVLLVFVLAIAAALQPRTGSLLGLVLLLGCLALLAWSTLRGGRR